MEPISIFAFVGLAIFVLSIKHFIDNCKSNVSNNEHATLVEEETPPKYEDIYN